MTFDSTRSYVVRLAVVSAVACAAWYFGIRPMREGLVTKRATLSAMEAEISSGQELVERSEIVPELLINELRRAASSLRELWAISADASVLYDAIDTIAQRYAITIERMEPRRGVPARDARGEGEDRPVFNEIAYTIDLLGTYENVARFLRAVQSELGMARVDSVRITPALSTDDPAFIRASVTTTHYQAEGGLAAFDAAPQEPTP